MSDRLLCRKWGGDKKEIRDSEDDGKENTNSWSVQYCLTFSKSKHDILGVLTVRTGNKAASEQCFRFGFSPTHLFLWATNLHWTANICLTLFRTFSLVLLIKSPSSSSSHHVSPMSLRRVISHHRHLDSMEETICALSELTTLAWNQSSALHQGRRLSYFRHLLSLLFGIFKCSLQQRRRE